MCKAKFKDYCKVFDFVVLKWNINLNKVHIQIQVCENNLTHTHTYTRTHTYTHPRININNAKYGYIITWILYQIFIFSNKVKHAAG